MPRGSVPRSLVAKLAIGLFRVAVQRVGHRADVFVVLQIQRFFRASLTFPSGPSAIERVLQNGELVWIIADVIDQAGQKHRADSGAPDANRSGNGGSSLF